jgi:opacity protein-like surface antigen
MKLHPVQFLLAVFALLLAITCPAVAAGPAAPSLLAPASGASVPEPLAISWSAVSDPSGIAGYNWQVSTSSTFGTVILQNSTNGATQDNVSGLANGQYFWRVQAVNGQLVQGAWSAAGSFTISGTSGGPAAPVLNQTQGYTAFHPREVITFTWSAAQGAAKYLLQFATDPTFPVATRGQFDNPVLSLLQKPAARSSNNSVSHRSWNHCPAGHDELEPRPQSATEWLRNPDRKRLELQQYRDRLAPAQRPQPY